MRLETDKYRHWMVIHIREPRVDAHNSDTLKDYFLKLMENGEKHLAVDLKEVRFIDSSGLGALLSGYKNANLHQGALVLAGLQPRVKEMFELTRLSRVFDIYEGIDEIISETRHE
ncbi:MAG: STAS domain-containing protein [Methylohalobius sp. ZOD2]|uniref:STAS domain-containing protein n=1 Tax=Methylohalobius crimeensis TaxID=244365 RepID=UPI0003B63CBD|nr:STAS domain-containing protein [Methylohalobius crimeensis]